MSLPRALLPLSSLLCLASIAVASTNSHVARHAANGMDMSMDDGMAMANGTMMPMLHFSLGDTLYFEGWVPQTRAALFGACVGLFLLAIVDRWLAAVRSLAEAGWRREVTKRLGADCDDDKNKKAQGLIRRIRLQAPPFVLAHDLTRGLLHALQAALGFAFMLAVMTFQAAYIITILGGLGVGEMLFGRYRAAADGAH
ncbi:CTR copper uptake transporter [Mycena indigotica]|uniref:Copper transport protein n=1 Tax=Mycena indigotica TaxID=2126181 RepID=A0A8H6SR33_9AGAR|nr:CTR copper uptake transporter [Mycena indigotica]KAF7303936.1 CTR copper uptake transporter [Mycena indigotica]